MDHFYESHLSSRRLKCLKMTVQRIHSRGVKIHLAIIVQLYPYIFDG